MTDETSTKLAMGQHSADPHAADSDRVCPVPQPVYCSFHRPPFHVLIPLEVVAHLGGKAACSFVCFPQIQRDDAPERTEDEIPF